MECGEPSRVERHAGNQRCKRQGRVRCNEGLGDGLRMPDCPAPAHSLGFVGVGLAFVFLEKKLVAVKPERPRRYLAGGARQGELAVLHPIGTLLADARE
jgi:hypothetical protein